MLSGGLGVDIAFADREGISWNRRASGELEELDKSSLEHFQDFGLHGPYGFTPLEAVT